MKVQAFIVGGAIIIVALVGIVGFSVYQLYEFGMESLSHSEAVILLIAASVLAIIGTVFGSLVGFILSSMKYKEFRVGMREGLDFFKATSKVKDESFSKRVQVTRQPAPPQQPATNVNILALPHPDSLPAVHHRPAEDDRIIEG